MLLQNVRTGRYAVVDPVDGTVSVTAETPEAAERWQRELLRDGTAEALAAAASADVAVVVLGNHPLIHGRETEDRAGIALPAAQDELLRAVAGVRPDTALVVMSSYPYALDWADENLPAVVWTSHGGQETGRALAAVLLGEAEPGRAVAADLVPRRRRAAAPARLRRHQGRLDLPVPPDRAAVPVRPRPLLHRLRLPGPDPVLGHRHHEQLGRRLGDARQHRRPGGQRGGPALRARAGRPVRGAPVCGSPTSARSGSTPARAGC